MNKFLLAVALVAVAAGQVRAKGPGCGSLTPPVLAGPGCGCPRVDSVEAAKQALEAASGSAMEKLEKIGQVPLEFAGILRLLPYGNESVSAKNPSTKDIKDILAAKRSYWDSVASVLNKEADRIAKEAKQAQDDGQFEPALKAAMASAKVRGQAKTAEAVVRDIDLDGNFKTEAGDMIERKLAIFRSLANQK